MDYLREGIHLRGFAQIDPLVAYKNEAFDAVQRPDEHHLVGLRADDLQRRGRGRGRERRRRHGAVRDSAAAAARPRGGRVSYSGGVGAPQPSALAPRPRRGAAWRPTATPRPSRGGEALPVVEQRRVDEQRADRAQRPVLVRLGQEVQEVPRRGLTGAGRTLSAAPVGHDRSRAPRGRVAVARTITAGCVAGRRRMASPPALLPIGSARASARRVAARWPSCSRAGACWCRVAGDRRARPQKAGGPSPPGGVARGRAAPAPRRAPPAARAAGRASRHARP